VANPGKVHSHTFRGRRYKIRWVPRMSDLARCDSPHTKAKEMVFEVGLHKDPSEELRIYLHEALHGCLWDLDEATIEACCEDISRFLRRLGYHRDK
jgi:hypothetical protein